jgi:hypothetical protein
VENSARSSLDLKFLVIFDLIIWPATEAFSTID